MDKQDDHDEKLENVSDGDDCVDFGGESNLPPPPTLTPEAECRLWRKVDIRLMPILTVMYLLSFMDRGELYEYHRTSAIWRLSCFIGNIGEGFMNICGGNLSVIGWTQETQNYRALRASFISLETNIT